MKRDTARLVVALLATTSTLALGANRSNKRSTTATTAVAVDAASRTGRSLLSASRRLENDGEVDFSWVSGYSIKFQGCHHITQWNVDADGDEDVRVAAKRLVRFRLCPTDDCTDESASGCDDGYGDYIVDMATYLEAYVENKANVEEWTCGNLEENVCGCDEADDEDQCLNDCYYANGADYCVEVEADDDEEPFDLADWVGCAQFDVDAGRRRRLNDEVEYFLGPYCADQGGDVLLGVFLDDTCTEFADEYGGRVTYKSFAGKSLPYSESSVLGLECLDCMEPKEANNDADQADEDETTEMCETMYATAGKCEKYLGLDDPNNNACNYMKGIKIIRSDGVMQTISSGSSTAAIFIGVFAAVFFLVGGYAYYLKTKLDKIILQSEP